MDKIGEFMEIKEIEITKKEKIYSLTESEYHELIREEREYGAEKTKEYIGFCYNNYPYNKKSMSGLISFVNDVIEFLEGNDYIRNTNKLSFFEWLDDNR